jgi:hypothetical protein
MPLRAGQQQSVVIYPLKEAITYFQSVRAA